MTTENQNRILTIHAVNGGRWVEKVGKYVVEVEFAGEPKKTLWVTEKQLKGLQNCVDSNGYANKKIGGYALFNAKGYFICASNSYDWIAEFSKKVV